MFHVLKPFNCPSCDIHYTGKDGYRSHTNSRYPLLLKCGHTCCENCINNAFKTQKNIQCTICEKVTEFEQGSNPIAKLLPDVYALGLVNVKQALPSLKNKLVPAVPLRFETKDGACVVCEHCSLREAKFRCTKCEENFCNICFDFYHNNRGRKKYHAATPIYAETYHSLVQEGCAEHDNRPIEFYCEEDNMLTCSHCVITGKHKGHNVITLMEKNESCFQELKNVYEEALGFSRRLKFTEQKLSQAIPMEKVDCSHWIKDIRIQFHNLHSILLQRENELLQQIEDISSSNVSHITKLRQEVSDTTKDVEALLRDAVCAMGNPTISISVPVIINKLAAVKHEPCHLLPISDGESNKEVSLMFEENLCNSIMQHGKISADIKPRYCLRGSNDLPDDFIVEPLPQELTTNATDTESLISETFSEDSLSASPAVNGLENLAILPLACSSSPKAKMEKVVVSHIVDPTCFYARKFTDNVKLDYITQGIIKSIRHKKFKSENSSKPKDGNIYLVRFSKDNKWYRGRIIRTISKTAIGEDLDNISESGDKLVEEQKLVNDSSMDIDDVNYEVYYIDYGNSEIIPLSSIRPIEKDMLRYPDLVKKCSLHNIVPIKDDTWTLEAKTVFHEFVFDKEVNMQIIEDVGGYLFVDLSQLPSIGPVVDVRCSVRDLLIFLEHGTFFDETELPKGKNIRKFRHYLPPEPVNVNARANVHIVCIESPSMFYVQQHSSSRHLSELMIDMQEVYSADTNLLHSVYVPYIGMICAAQLPDDNMWYRAEVLSLPGGAKVELEFVDFGTKQILHHRYLRQILDNFTKLNRQALPCTLADVSATSNAVEWSAESTKWLLEYTEQKRFTLLSLGYEPGSPKTKVVLYDLKGELEICINALMVEKGVALSTGLYSTVVHRCREKPKVSPQIDKVIPKTKKGKKTVFEELVIEKPTEEASCLFYEAEPEFRTSPEPELPKPKEPLPEHVKVLMSHIESPGVFYIRIEGEESTLKKMMAGMQTTYANFESSPVDIKIGNHYAGYRESDKTWYRVIVQSVIDDETIQARFPDYGYFDKVPVEHLRPLLPKFEAEKAYAIRCYLSGVMAAGDSQKWSRVAIDMFIEITQPYNVLFLVNGVADDDNKELNSLPSDLYFEEFVRGGALEPSTLRYTSVTKKLIDGGVALPVRMKKSTKVENASSPIPSEIASTSAQAVNEFELSPVETPQGSPEPKKPPRKPSFQWKPAIIPAERKFKAYGTHVGHDGCIYLQVCPDGVSNAEFVKGTLQLKYETSPFHSVRIAPPIGEACIAEFDLDKKYYRAETVTDDPMKLKVQFVDYGNFELVNLKKIQVASMMKELARQCIECELVDVDPPSGSWPSNVLNYIHSHIVEVYCDIEVVEPPEPGKRLQIQLNFPQGNLNSLVAGIFYVEEPMLNGMGSSDSVEQLDHGSFLEATALQLNNTFPVCVTRVLEPTVIYLQHLHVNPPLSEDHKQRNRELDNFLKLQSHLASNGCNFPLVASPMKGMSCIAKYSYDHLWYRCIILEVEEDYYAIVRYVDYGNVETVPVKELREPDLYTLDIPVQAHLCKIKDLEPASDTWIPTTAKALEKLLINVDNPQIALYARVISKSDVYEIELLIQEEDSSFKLVYDDLIQKGLLKFHCNSRTADTNSK